MNNTPPNGFPADLFHALRGLGHVADDEVFLGDLHDVGPLNLAQPEQDFGDDAREAGLGGAGRAFEHHVVLVGRGGLLALGGQQLVDLNLDAPHRDLLLGASGVSGPQLARHFCPEWIDRCIQRYDLRGRSSLPRRVHETIGAPLWSAGVERRVQVKRQMR